MQDEDEKVHGENQEVQMVQEEYEEGEEEEEEGVGVRSQALEGQFKLLLVLPTHQLHDVQQNKKREPILFFPLPFSFSFVCFGLLFGHNDGNFKSRLS